MAEYTAISKNPGSLSSIESQAAISDLPASEPVFHSPASDFSFTDESLPPLPQTPEDSGIPLEELPDNVLSSSHAFPSFGEVRFLIAASVPFPLTISIDQTIYAEHAAFGTVGSYNLVPDGFHKIRIYYSYGPRVLLFQKDVPFYGGRVSTIVVLDSEDTGITISQIDDHACETLPPGYGCYRVANMSVEGSSLDILMAAGEPVFLNIRYPSVTSYKQASEGTWDFQAASLTCFGSAREIPSIPGGSLIASCAWAYPALTYQAHISAGKSYTTYLIGNSNPKYRLHGITVEDDSPGQIPVPYSSRTP